MPQGGEVMDGDTICCVASILSITIIMLAILWINR
jgi:hypothetical protein